MSTPPIHQTLISGVTVGEMSGCQIGHIIGPEITSSSQTIISDCHVKSLKGVQIGHRFTSSPPPSDPSVFLEDRYIFTTGGTNTWIPRNPKPGLVSKLPVSEPPTGPVRRLSVMDNPAKLKSTEIPTTGTNRYVRTKIIHPPTTQKRPRKSMKQRRRELWRMSSKKENPSIEITIIEEFPSSASSLGPEFEIEEEKEEEK